MRDVVVAIQLSRATMRKIRQNLFWAFFYNIVLIPLAAGAFYPIIHVLFNPVYAAAAMASSSVTDLNQKSSHKTSSNVFGGEKIWQKI